MRNFSNYKLDDLGKVINHSNKIHEIETSLSEIINEKTNSDEDFEYCLQLWTLESAARYRLSCIADYPIEKTREYLIKACACAKSIQYCCKKLNYNPNTPIFLNAIHQEAIILYELNRFGTEPIKDLNKAIKLLDYVQENSDSEPRLKHYAIFHKSNCLLELARLGNDVQNNCLKALKLSEISRKNFYNNSKEYKELNSNQTLAISLLMQHDDNILNVEFYKTIQKLLEEAPKNELTSLFIELKLLDLGYGDYTILDKNLNKIQNMKENSSNDERKYHDLNLLEGDYLIKKAEFDESRMISLLNCISHFEDYKKEETFDIYYIAKNQFKEAYVRYELSKLNYESLDGLYKAKSLLKSAKEFYLNVPHQNKEHNCAFINLYLSKTMKELALHNDSLKEESSNIEKTLLMSLNYFINNNKDKERIVDCYWELGELFFKTEDYEKSYENLNNAIEVIELMRNSIPNLNARKKFLEKRVKIFKQMIDVCYNLERYGESLKFVELSKHRIFLDKKENNEKKNLKINIDCNLLHYLNNIESAIKFKLNKLKYFYLHQFEFSHDYEKLIKLKKQQEYFIYKLKHEFPEYYDYYYNHFFDYRKINLPDKTLIEYYYTDEFMLIFLVEKNKIYAEKVEFQHTTLFDSITAFKNKIKKITHDYDGKIVNEEFIKEFEKIMENFFKLLIKPIKNILHSKNLVIIPYKELHNIPFNCLKQDDEYMIDKYTISIAQNGSSIKYLLNKPQATKKRNSLVIGNPDNTLPDADKESLFIADVLNAKVLMNEEATKDNVLNSITGKNIIHFAGHGSFNLKNPLYSHITLHDGELYVKDLEELNLNSELVVLSSCESGISNIDETDEVDGFISYLQLDGVKHIIASLWSVDSPSTMKIFEEFYSLNEDYSENLRLAQLKLKSNPHSNILEWGAFQIYGI